MRGWRSRSSRPRSRTRTTTDDAREEFGRRARIGAGNWQALARLPDLLDPRTGFVAFAFVSHKLLRWATPFLLAVALVANVALAAAPGAWGYRALLARSSAFYALALSGRRGAAGPLRRLARGAHYFVAMNAALAVGFWRFVRGHAARGVAADRADRGTRGVTRVTAVTSAPGSQRPRRRHPGQGRPAGAP